MDEIEAKFTVPDGRTWQQLQKIDRLADYTLGAVQVETIQDTFLDTAGRAILSANFYCRQRAYAGQPGVWITLKSLGGRAGALHRREELQMPLPAPLPPDEWTAGPIRERVLGWIGPESLVPLLRLRQVRHVRPVLHAGELVAELSLDDVHLSAGRRRESFLELEVERTAAGTDADLVALTRALQTGWSLLPQGRSKFERALAFLEQDPPGLLAPDEHTICTELARRNDLHGRRARALLALDAGQTQEEAGRQSGMSERRVRYWQAAFRQKRLRIFPDRIRAATPNQQRKAPQSVSPPLASEPAEMEDSVHVDELVTNPEPAPELVSKPGALDPDDTMLQAARKTMVRHMQRMVDNEQGVRLGEDIEAVHDMRVATRRMRAALRVFDDYLDDDVAAALTKVLRRAGRTLGVVRDMDVFRDKAQHYLDARPEAERSGLDPFLAVWEARYQRAREALLAYLDGERYAQLKTLLSDFLRGTGPEETLEPGVEPRPHRLRQVVPVALYQSLAAVRAYDEWLAVPPIPLGRYHQLRIASKRLRYTLEFFREVLGPEAGLLVGRIKALQDHLGDLQDAVVACGLLRDFLIWGTWGRPAQNTPWPVTPIVAPGVATYLAFRQAEIQRLVETFPAAWDPVRGPEFGQLLAASVAVLL
jgi:CHAD domain-containing protein